MSINMFFLISIISSLNTMNSSYTNGTSSSYLSKKSGYASSISSLTSSSHAFLNSDGSVNALDVLFLFFAFKVLTSWRALTF